MHKILENQLQPVSITNVQVVLFSSQTALLLSEASEINLADHL